MPANGQDLTRFEHIFRLRRGPMRVANLPSLGGDWRMRLDARGCFDEVLHVALVSVIPPSSPQRDVFLRGVDHIKADFVTLHAGVGTRKGHESQFAWSQAV